LPFRNSGELVARGAGQIVAPDLYGVSPYDPATYLTILVVLTTISLIASWLPAHRAARVDPATTLRY